jgi:hypothetical protein
MPTLKTKGIPASDALNCESSANVIDRLLFRGCRYSPPLEFIGGKRADMFQHSVWCYRAPCARRDRPVGGTHE